MKVKSTKYSRNYAIIFLLLVSSFNFLFSQESSLIRPSIKTIVIDAGHGGKDPGCHGSSALEKHVCLSIALALGEMIKNNHPDIDVVYTRETDVFVELDERAKIANKNNADLFICIHANSATASVHGAETYVLGLHKTEAQQQIAERENATIYLEEDKGAKYKDFDLTPDALIARQIQLSVFLNQSINFASKLQYQFNNLGRNDRGVKQAGFLVLYKTTMPSVLIETGFLTNKNEELFLNNKDNQQKMANAMFTAFESYRTELEGVNASSNKTNEIKNGEKVVEVKRKDTKNPFKQETVSNVKKEESLVKKETIVKEPLETSQKPMKSTDDTNQNKVIFRVQIETSDIQIDLKDKQFKGLNVFEYKQNGIYKYTVGNFINDYNGAINYRREILNKGFKGAFIVAFFNNERIILEKAINLVKK